MESMHKCIDLPFEAERYYDRRHPVFSLVGMRPVIAQHTLAEEKLLQRYAARAKTIVEIGVAEGASALALRQACQPDATLYLVDPYPSGRIPGLNIIQLIAKKHVNRSNNASVQWIKQFSHDAVKTWSRPIDFLFLDGDHGYEGCMRDWRDWNHFVGKEGFVAFHDARLFNGGWTKKDWGPVRVVEEVLATEGASWKLLDQCDSVVVLGRR